jgi:small-conductance mechanosensitive channel
LLFFRAVETGGITLKNFDREWAMPTYRLVRTGLIAFALVVAYPSIPGAGSDAFKGVTLFLGVLVSLGSSSAVSNIIAGYMLVYRRAFRVGDRVRIGETLGDVTEMRLQVTHVRTIKNETVTIPNSTILSAR